MSAEKSQRAAITAEHRAIVGQSIGRRLRHERERHRLSRLHLSRRACIAPSTIGRIERGESVPDARMLLGIMAAFPALDLVWLLTGVSAPVAAAGAGSA